jgi:MFS family permease
VRSGHTLGLLRTARLLSTARRLRARQLGGCITDGSAGGNRTMATASSDAGSRGINSVLLLGVLPCVWCLGAASISATWLLVAMLFLVGFCLYGPFSLISSAVSIELAEVPDLPRNAATRARINGLINGAGSLGACLQGVVIGIFGSSVGWTNVFTLLQACCAVSVLTLARGSYDEDRRALLRTVPPSAGSVVELSPRPSSPSLCCTRSWRGTRRRPSPRADSSRPKPSPDPSRSTPDGRAREAVVGRCASGVAACWSWAAWAGCCDASRRLRAQHAACVIIFCIPRSTRLDASRKHLTI